MTRGPCAVAGLRRSHPIPDDATRDAVLDQLDSLFRRALEVEGLRQSAPVERVVRDRDLLVEDLLTHLPGERASFLEQAERAERVMREVFQEIGEGVRPEHGAVDA